MLYGILWEGALLKVKKFPSLRRKEGKGEINRAAEGGGGRR